MGALGADAWVAYLERKVFRGAGSLEPEVQGEGRVPGGVGAHTHLGVLSATVSQTGLGV